MVIKTNDSLFDKAKKNKKISFIAKGETLSLKDGEMNFFTSTCEL